MYILCNSYDLIILSYRFVEGRPTFNNIVEAEAQALVVSKHMIWRLSGNVLFKVTVIDDRLMKI